METKEIYKSKIEKIMKNVGISNNSAFCAATGIDMATLSNILSGKTMPSLKILQKIKTKFPHIDTEWLFLDIDSMPEEKTNSQEQLLTLNFDENNEKSTTSAAEVTPKNVAEISTKEKEIVNFTENRQNDVPKIEIPSIAEQKPELPLPVIKENKILKKIIVYYSDSTYQELQVV